LKRLAEGRHVTGSARTRRTLAQQPDGPFGAVFPVRPGELTQIDSTPLDVAVVLADGVVGRVELTGLVDIQAVFRLTCAHHLRKSSQAMRFSWLRQLARALRQPLNLRQCAITRSTPNNRADAASATHTASSLQLGGALLDTATSAIAKPTAPTIAAKLCSNASHQGALSTRTAITFAAIRIGKTAAASLKNSVVPISLPRSAPAPATFQHWHTYS